MGKLLTLLAIFAVLFMGVKFVNETRKLDATETDTTKMATIDVSGQGVAFAVPDIASISFTVENKAASVHDAQLAVTSKANAAISFLKKSGVAEKDIQTTDYNAYPQYDYPRMGEPKLLGYTVSETVTAKVRDTGSTGNIIDGLGATGVTGISGPQFTVDDPDTINAEARTKAIADAKQKAEILSRQLGVSLVRIVRFSESNGGYPMPLYAAKDAVGMSAGAASAPVLPTGQNKYTSNVTITYAIE